MSIKFSDTLNFAKMVVEKGCTDVLSVTDECNETLGWFPCMDGSCYFYDQRCDQIRQCIDGQDEMGCKP